VYVIYNISIAPVLQTKRSNWRTIRQSDKALRDNGLLSAGYFGTTRNLFKKPNIFYFISITEEKRETTFISRTDGIFETFTWNNKTRLKKPMY
jgi:hypothetical protein